jgi:serine/threonine-protein kinase RsbW
MTTVAKSDLKTTMRTPQRARCCYAGTKGGRKPVRTQTPKAPEAITFESAYPGTPDQAKHVRADLAKVAGDCPVLDELVLLASELATNAILHSRSGHPTRRFTVRATLCPSHYAWVEVTDDGGTWTADRADDEQGRGLAIVAAIAGDGNWGIDGDSSSRAAWFRLNWDRTRLTDAR